MKAEKALLVEGLSSSAELIQPSLKQCLHPHFCLEHLCTPAGNREAQPWFAKQIKQICPAIIFLTLNSSWQTNNLLSLIRQSSPAPIVLIIVDEESKDILELTQDKVDDFITLPLKAAEVRARALKLSAPSVERPARDQCSPVAERSGLIGKSATFVEQVRRIGQIARWKANVLLTGETGTGKELYARAIHYSSPRAGQPFMPVNCGAIPAELVENELFGHERGAYTSAVSLQTGLIEEANGGTLFLDEIDCLPVLAQVKLLRFLQEKEYRPLGSARMKQANVRIIAASNVNLEEAVGHGKVRQDLFYRLNIISIALPPLRERREDIPLLADHFLSKYARECEKEICGFSHEALHLLMFYRWPGNVRELEHAVERAVILCEADRIEVNDLLLSNADLDRRRESLQEAKAKEIARFEKNYIQGVLSVCRGNITAAAQVAQKNRRAFWQLIQKHEIDVAQFKRTG